MITEEEYNGRSILSLMGPEDLRPLGLKMGQIQIIMNIVNVIKSESGNVQVNEQL